MFSLLAVLASTEEADAEVDAMELNAVTVSKAAREKRADVRLDPEIWKNKKARAIPSTSESTVEKIQASEISSSHAYLVLLHYLHSPRYVINGRHFGASLW
jgi:hypothetical protein